MRKRRWQDTVELSSYLILWFVLSVGAPPAPSMPPTAIIPSYWCRPFTIYHDANRH